MKIGAICCALMPIFREREIGFALRALEGAGAGRRRRVPRSRARRGGGGDAGGATPDGDTAPRGGVEHVLVVGADGAPALPKTEGARWHDFAAAVAGQEPDAAAIVARKPAPDGALPALLHLRLDRRAERRPAPLRRAHPGGDDGGRAPRPRPRRHDLHPHPARPPDRAALRDVAELRARLDPGHPGRLGRRAAAPRRCASGTAPSCRRRRRSSPTWCGWSRRARSGAAGAADLRRHRRRGAAGAGRARDRACSRAAVCGAWGSTESCLGALAAPGDDPEKVWGTDGRALAGTRIRIVDDDGQGARPRRGGQLRGRPAAASSRATSTVPT